MACFNQAERIGCWFLLVLLLISGAGAIAHAAESEAVPRYKLHVGQELVYRARTQTVTFYVARSNPDGGWHLFELYRYPGMMSSKGVPATPILECEFDLTPDGKASLKQAGGLSRVLGLLPPLPPDASTTQWQANGPQEEVLHFHVTPATQPTVRTLVVDLDGPLLRSGRVRATSDIVFDTAQGLPVRIENHSEFVATHRKVTAVTELVENKIHPAEWAEQVSGEAGALLAAQSRYWDEMHSAGETTDDAQYTKACDAALVHLKELRPRLTFPEILEVIDTFIGLHGRHVFFGRGPVALLGQSAPVWHFPDLQGKQHALADYRGKVVVLDFWYRNCPYCIVEMPHVKKLAARYSDKPAVFLGMNVDVDPRDAEAMVTQQGLTFPTLITKGLGRAEGPATRPAAGSVMVAAYHIKGYPTVLVLGPDGIARQVVGYSDAFEENLAKAIDSLLPTAQ